MWTNCENADCGYEKSQRSAINKKMLKRAGEMYLYDIMNIKKETSTLFQSEDITQ